MKLKFPIIFHKGQRWAVVVQGTEHDPDKCYLRGEDGRRAEAYIHPSEVDKAEVRLFKEIET